jgi:hypothetical protein
MSTHEEGTTDPVLEQWRRDLGAVYLPEGVEIWLMSPNRLLGGTIPFELLATEREDEVAQVIEMLTTGSFA